MLIIFILHFINVSQSAENSFDGILNKHASLLLKFELANHIQGYLSGGYLEKDLVVQFEYSSAAFSDKEESIVLYVAGCFFLYFLVD